MLRRLLYGIAVVLSVPLLSYAQWPRIETPRITPPDIRPPDPRRILRDVEREARRAGENVAEIAQKAAPALAVVACPACAVVHEAVKNNPQLVTDITQTGLVITAANVIAGPAGGAYVVYTMLSVGGDGTVYQKEVEVPIHEASETGKRYEADLGANSCMVQHATGKISVYSIDQPPFWNEVRAGDIVQIRTPVCAKYNNLSGITVISSATIKIIGANFDRAAPDDGKSARYTLVGRPHSGG